MSHEYVTRRAEKVWGRLATEKSSVETIVHLKASSTFTLLLQYSDL